MKHPCPSCKRVVDDGKPCPEGHDPAMLAKSHRYCPECLVELEAEANALLAKLERERKQV